MKAISTHLAPPPGGCYSQAVEIGSLIFTAGLGPHDPATGGVVGATIEEQTARTLESIQAVLIEAGASLRDVVKVTAHLSDPERDFVGYDHVYQSYFQEPYPARTTVGSVLIGALIEVDVVAVRRAVAP